MKRRLLTLAALSPVLAAPMLMQASDQPVSDLERPLQVASRGPIVTPATTMPADAADLEIPSLDELAVESDYTATIDDHIERLDAAAAKLDAIDSYTAKLVRQERVDGYLKDAETTKLKLRHDRFSVYMKWRTGDAGREALYVEGQNDNQMLVHPGGWKGRFLPTLSVDPDGTLARSESRHSVKEAGLRNLVERHLEHRHAERTQSGITATTRATTFEDRPATELEVIYTDESQNPAYSRTILVIDDELGLPVASRNYGWTAIDREGDEATLVERYEYRELDIEADLTDADFERENRRYCFR